MSDNCPYKLRKQPLPADRLVFLVNTRFPVSCAVNPLDELNTSDSARCSVSVLLAVVNGFEVLYRHDTTINRMDSPFKNRWATLYWADDVPDGCMVELHISEPAVAWLDMLCTGACAPRRLAKLLCDARGRTVEKYHYSNNLRRLAVRYDERGTRSYEAHILREVSRVNILVLTKKQKRMLLYEAKHVEVHFILNMIKAIGVNEEMTKHFVLLNQTIRRTHPHIANFVDSNGTPPPPILQRRSWIESSPQVVVHTHVQLSKTQLGAKCMNTFDSHSSSSSLSSPTSPRSECRSPTTTTENGVRYHPSVIEQDRVKLRSHNFPPRLEGANLASSADWNAQACHTGLVWDPCPIDGHPVFKPRNFPSHFQVGRMGWSSIW